MRAAAWPREAPSEERLLAVDPRTDRFDDARVGDLARFLRKGDLLVVNDAATLPAALSLTSSRGEPIEVRLMGHAPEGEWWAVLFGEGDWRTRTEDREEPPALALGETLRVGEELAARVTGLDGRFVRLAFDRDGAALWRALYRHGAPIQYAHVRAPLSLWHVQSRFASRPWAFEAPSAGRPLSWELLGELRKKGVGIARITHAAGISSTGSDALDRRLPLAERSEVPAETVERIRETRGRVVAVGTTVVRALESRAARGELSAGVDHATLVIGPGFRPRVVNGVLSGMHPPATSHFAVLEAFAPRSLLERALAHAERSGYLEHEFGDSCLVLPS